MFSIHYYGLVKMNRHHTIILFAILVLSIPVGHASDTIPHKHRMIDAINAGNFEQAIAEVPWVEDWKYTQETDMRNVAKFIYIADSIGLAAPLVDSLFLYYARYGDEMVRIMADSHEIDDAIGAALAVVDVKEHAVGEKHPEYTKSLEKLADLYFYNLDDIEKAAEYYDQIYELCPNYLVWTKIWTLGDYFLYSKDYAKAEKYYLKLSEFSTDIVEGGHADLGLAYVHFVKKDFVNAEKYCQRALKYFKKNIEGDLDKYEALTFLGSLYLEMGKCQKAKSCIQKVVRTRGENVELYDYEYALNTLGTPYSNKQKYSKAEPYLKAARDDNKNRYFLEMNWSREEDRANYWKNNKYAFEQIYPKFAYSYHYHEPQISVFAYENELFSKGLLLTSSLIISQSILESGDTAFIHKWEQLSALNRLCEEEQNESSYALQQKAKQAELDLIFSWQTSRADLITELPQLSLTWDSVRTRLLTTVSTRNIARYSTSTSRCPRSLTPRTHSPAPSLCTRSFSSPATCATPSGPTTSANTQLHLNYTHAPAHVYILGVVLLSSHPSPNRSNVPLTQSNIFYNTSVIVQVFSEFCTFYLHNSEKCSTFAASNGGVKSKMAV